MLPCVSDQPQFLADQDYFRRRLIRVAEGIFFFFSNIEFGSLYIKWLIYI